MTSQNITIGTLGPALTWSHLATQAAFPKREIVFFSSFPECFAALKDGAINQLLLPIENKMSGSVMPVWTALVKNNWHINAAYDMPIKHCLVGKRKAILRQAQDDNVVFGHPHALVQCNAYLTEHYQKAKRIEATSNSIALQLAKEQDALALCTRQAAEKQNMYIIAENIGDNPHNITRFGCITNDKRCCEAMPNQKCITSLAYELPHKPGSLLRSLEIFANDSRNLIKIESHPTGKQMNDYIFFVDIEGNMTPELWENMQKYTQNSQILGEYSITKIF